MLGGQSGCRRCAMEPWARPAADLQASIQALLVFAMIAEGMLVFVFSCLGVAELFDWIERRGWRPPDREKKP